MLIFRDILSKLQKLMSQLDNHSHTGVLSSELKLCSFYTCYKESCMQYKLSTEAHVPLTVQVRCSECNITVSVLSLYDVIEATKFKAK